MIVFWTGKVYWQWDSIPTATKSVLYYILYLFGVFVDYYMAMSQKDWKQTNSRIWSAKIDLDRGLDFPI